MLASADHPIGPGLEVGDLTVSTRRPIPVCNHRMAVRNQICVRVEVEIERAIMPENQRLISSGQSVTCPDLAQVRVIDQETGQTQEERCNQRSQVSRN